MGTGKPLIAILMAVYEPRMDWLREQLVSLEGQTYPNLRLYLRDDCSPTVPFGEIEACVAECIRSFPCKVWRNEENLGSNRTFERLTEEAEGEYFAYCDQDDVWLPEKLAILQEELEGFGAQLTCSDMYIIDGGGKVVADSITKIRRHHRFRSGTGLTDTLWCSNFASGCALLVRAETAKAAVPFNPYMYYDHYITLFAANGGSIAFVDRPLIRHREHGGNQSSTLQGGSGPGELPEAPGGQHHRGGAVAGGALPGGYGAEADAGGGGAVDGGQAGVSAGGPVLGGDGMAVSEVFTYGLSL